MPTEVVLDLLEQARIMGFQGDVAFHFYSEPLLDKRNLFLAREAGAMGMKPYLHTNGDVLAGNPTLREEIVEVYDHVVIGLYDYRSESDLDAGKSRWLELLKGVDVRFSYIPPDASSGLPNMGIPRALVPTDARMSVPDLKFQNAPCHRPLLRMLIRYDGEMANCCEDAFTEFGLGNIRDHSLEELWFSDRHLEIVSDLQQGNRQKYPLCSNCPLAPSGPAQEGKEMDIRKRNYRGPEPMALHE
jgi:radical SAM protein with 4Fe4S-binding SPASM domain